MEQLPLLTELYQWYADLAIPDPAGDTRCTCDDTEHKTWDHLKTSPLYRELDTLTDCNLDHTIAQHAGWLPRSPAAQSLSTMLQQTQVSKGLHRGRVLGHLHPGAQQRGRIGGKAAHMLRTAVTKAATPLIYCNNIHLQHAATLLRQSRRTSSNSCSSNLNAPSSNLPTGAAPSQGTIHQTQHRCGTHKQHRQHTHAHQHAHNANLNARTPPSAHRYRPPPTTACHL